MTKKKKFWVVERYQNNELVFQETLPYGTMTEKQMGNYITSLNVKYFLDDDEAVDCFLKKNVKGYRECLEVKIDRHGNQPVLYCQDNLDILAAVVEEANLHKFTDKAPNQ